MAYQFRECGPCGGQFVQGPTKTDVGGGELRGVRLARFDARFVAGVGLGPQQFVAVR